MVSLCTPTVCIMQTLCINRSSPAITMAGCARVAMLQSVWGCANKPSSSWLIYLVYSERSPKRPSRGGGGGAGGGGGGGAGWMIQWSMAGRIRQAFYIFIQSKVLLNWLWRSRGRAGSLCYMMYALLPFRCNEMHLNGPCSHPHLAHIVQTLLECHILDVEVSENCFHKSNNPLKRVICGAADYNQA